MTVPIHARNGYRHDEHYWAWIRHLIRTGEGAFWAWCRLLQGDKT